MRVSQHFSRLKNRAKDFGPVLIIRMKIPNNSFSHF